MLELSEARLGNLLVSRHRVLFREPHFDISRAKVTQHLKSRLERAGASRGLALSVDIADLGGVSPGELFTCACLSEPLVLWRGLLCADDDLRSRWVLYKADDDVVSDETAMAADTLIQLGMLIDLPSARAASYISERRIAVGSTTPN